MQNFVMQKPFSLLLIVFISFGATAAEHLLTQDGISGLDLGNNNLVSEKEVLDSFPGYTVIHREGSWEGPDYNVLSVNDAAGNFVFAIISYKEGIEAEQREEYPMHKIYLGEGITDEYGIKRGDKILKAFEKRGKELKLVANHHDNSLGKGHIYYEFSYPLTQEEIDAQFGINWGFAPSIQAVKDRNPTIEKVVWINWP